MAARRIDDSLEIFAIGGPDDSLWHTYQQEDDTWSTWADLGNQYLDSIAVASNSDGRLEVMAVVNQTLQHIYQVAPSSTWSTWASLGAPSTGALGQVAVTKHANDLWWPTLDTTPIELEVRSGYGVVGSEAIVQIRSSELSLNAPGAMSRPQNTLGAWKYEHDLFYWYTDAATDAKQLTFKLVKPGATPGEAIVFGDAISIQSDFPSFRGEAMKPSGNFVTTARGATDLWIIEPLP